MEILVWVTTKRREGFLHFGEIYFHFLFCLQEMHVNLPNDTLMAKKKT